MDEVENYIHSLNGAELAISNYLHQIILNTSPKITTKLSYGVPYYKINYRLCFIWPASSPFAIEKEGVQLGFCKGSLLSNTQGILDMGKRKEVAIVNFTHINQINEQQLTEILFEAIDVDSWAKQQRLKK